MHSYSGKKPAERLELFIFTCPECGRTGTLSSHGSRFGCSVCGYDVIYNKYGFFEGSVQTLHFDTPADWNRWQLEKLETGISESARTDPGSVLAEDADIVLRTGSKTKALEGLSDKGVLRLFSGRLEYISAEKQVFCFPLKKITGVNIQYNNQLEFIFDNTLYRFSKKDGSMPAYRFVMSVEAAKRFGAGAAQHQ
jgi:1-acyl-sn-glycerol-3-phosphate acyltransferase